MGSNPEFAFILYFKAHDSKLDKCLNNGDNSFSRVCLISITNTEELLQAPIYLGFGFSQKLKDVLFDECVTNALLTHSSRLIIYYVKC